MVTLDRWEKGSGGVIQISILQLMQTVLLDSEFMIADWTLPQTGHITKTDDVVKTSLFEVWIYRNSAWVNYSLLQ